jgi:hypothetical protein
VSKFQCAGALNLGVRENVRDGMREWYARECARRVEVCDLNYFRPQPLPTALYWPRYNEDRGVFEELVTEENRWWPTFLDFSYEERRAMQVICVFCDSRQEHCLCS